MSVDEGISKGRKEERDNSTREKWKTLEKDPDLWFKLRGVFILLCKRVEGLVSRGAVVGAGRGIEGQSRRTFYIAVTLILCINCSQLSKRDIQCAPKLHACFQL